MSTAIFSVCHATARPHGWQKAFDSCVQNAANRAHLEYILSIDERFGDFGLNECEFPTVVRLNASEPQDSVPNWNNACQHASGKVLLLSADDFRFPPNWDRELLTVIPDLDADFVVHASTGNPDQAWEDRLIAFIIMSRKRYEHQDGFALYPGYNSMGSDVDLTEHAYLDGVVIQARHICFEHLHPAFRKAKTDRVYDWQNRAAAYGLADKILTIRRMHNFTK